MIVEINNCIGCDDYCIGRICNNYPHQTIVCDECEKEITEKETFILDDKELCFDCYNWYKDYGEDMEG